jgi:hypothetical protein
MAELDAAPRVEIDRLIRRLESLYKGEETVDLLVALGPAAVAPLSEFLLKGRPSKVFQPRLWAVQALARLAAREVLLAYLFQAREISDPEASFGEEAVASAAARCLAAWPDEATYRLLLQLSERRPLNGLIEALAQFKTRETIPYLIRALEDDFYRPAAEEAFLKLGALAHDALVQAAVTPLPDAALETPASLKRRRSAVRLLSSLGISAASWQILRGLLLESDAELVVEAAKLGVRVASEEDRALMARRLLKLLAATSWHLLADIEATLIPLRPEAAGEVDKEIARGLEQQEDRRVIDLRLRALLRVKGRWEQAAAQAPQAGSRPRKT